MWVFLKQMLATNRATVQTGWNCSWIQKPVYRCNGYTRHEIKEPRRIVRKRLIGLLLSIRTVASIRSVSLEIALRRSQIHD